MDPDPNPKKNYPLFPFFKRHSSPWSVERKNLPRDKVKKKSDLSSPRIHPVPLVLWRIVEEGKIGASIGEVDGAALLSTSAKFACRFRNHGLGRPASFSSGEETAWLKMIREPVWH
jgi:hypothetical protein